MITPENRPHIVVVGAGFGGLFAARNLDDADADITLIDKNNYHTFIPLLYQVAAAELEPEEIAYPVRTIARNQKNMRFVMAEVTDVDLEKQRIVTDSGNVAYDYLILSAGSMTNFFGLESVARHAFGIKDLPEALSLRNHILQQFELASHESDPKKLQALLTFVIVGGGPTGVEYSATLSELIRGILAKDYPELPFDRVRIVLLEAADTVLPFLDADLGRYTARTLERKGVEVVVNAKVTGATEEEIQLEDMEPIGARTVVWTAGVKASDLAGRMGVDQGRAGRIVVTSALHVPDHPHVYVVGDMAYVEQEGIPVPQVAPAAIQQARVAAENIKRHMNGEPPVDFHYDDKGTMVTIGRNKGVAVVGRFSIKGFIAWIAWLVVHIIRLIGFRNRLYVLSSWAWSYIFQDRIRLIIKSEPDRVKPSDGEADG